MTEGRKPPTIDREARARFAATRRHREVLEAVAGDEGTDEVFDPADHTIDEVLAHIDEHPETLDAVAAAERAGKARTTLLAKLDELIAGRADDEADDDEADDEKEGDDDAAD